MAFLNPVTSSIGGLKFPVMKIKPVVPPGAAPPGAPPTDINAAAQAIAAGLIDPQIAAINRAVSQRQLDAQGQQKAYEGVIRAVADATAGIPGAIQGGYQTAADHTAEYAGTLTGTLGDQARAAAAEAAARIHGLGAPGTVTAETGGLNTANYLGGTLPASSLAAEAASRLAEASSLRAAGSVSLGQQALQAMQATNQEVADLQAKGLDLEMTRPAEVQKALATLREEATANAELDLKKQQLLIQAQAAGVQGDQLNRAWYQTLATEAWNRTNATGTLWSVKGNKLVNTGRPAPGSAAAKAHAAAVKATADRRAANKRTTIQQAGATKRTRITAQASQARAAEAARHNMAMEGIANSRIGISQQQANTAAKRETRLLKSKAKGGFSTSQIAKWGKETGQLAFTAFHGAPNPNYNPQAPTDPKDANYDPRMIKRYVTAPMEPGDFLKAMLARGVPYSIAYTAIRQFASQPGSWWAPAMSWQKTWPPPHGA